MANNGDQSNSDDDLQLLKGKRLLCVVTGASRGIGKEIAIRLAAEVGQMSPFLILARNADGLQKTAQEMKCSGNSVNIHVETLSLDLSTFDQHQAAFENALKNLMNRSSGKERFDVALLVHNAATIGRVDRSVENIDDAKEIRQYFELNFNSFVLLNNLFLKTVEDCASIKAVVNITSLAAIRGIAGFGLYSAGKAAREGFMRSLAADNPSIRVLNYAPGPVATDMLDKVIAETHSEETKIQYKEHCHPLTCEQTVTRLINLLNENRFANGTRIDYYDEH